MDTAVGRDAAYFSIFSPIFPSPSLHTKQPFQLPNKKRQRQKTTQSLGAAIRIWGFKSEALLEPLWSLWSGLSGALQSAGGLRHARCHGSFTPGVQGYVPFGSLATLHCALVLPHAFRSLPRSSASLAQLSDSRYTGSGISCHGDSPNFKSSAQRTGNTNNITSPAPADFHFRQSRQRNLREPSIISHFTSDFSHPPIHSTTHARLFHHPQSPLVISRQTSRQPDLINRRKTSLWRFKYKGPGSLSLTSTIATSPIATP